jgi:hypothetical protein
MSPKDFYFQLTDSDGNPFKGTCMDAVELPSNTKVFKFRKAVKAEYADSHLKGIAPSDLLVYKNRTAFENRNADQGKATPLEVDLSINNLGETEEEALIVVVPKSHSQGNFEAFIKR